MYPKFHILKMPNFSNKDTWSIRKRLLRSALNKRNKELQHLSKELSLSKNFLSTQLYVTDFSILTKPITSSNRNCCRNCYALNKKNYLHWRRIPSYIFSQLTKLLLISPNMNYLGKNLIYLMQAYTFQSD